MRLFETYLHEAIDTMERDHIRLKILGEQARISPELRRLIAKTDEISAHYDGFQANVCINYGGRDEIVRAARKFAALCMDGSAKPEELTEGLFSGLLDTAGIPAPAEYYFTDVLWPDFDEEELKRAILSYQGRNRRFGGVK